jgi:hypothetical protein
MPELSELIREYGGLLVQEGRISERKERLRAAIAEEMARRNLKSTTTEHGSVSRTARFKLVIKRPSDTITRNAALSNGRSVKQSSDGLALIEM